MSKPQVLTDVNIFIDGTTNLGVSKKVTLPKIEKVRQSQTSGGFERTVDTGIFKELECELTLAEYSQTVFTSMSAGNASGKGVLFTIKGSIFQDGSRVPLIATVQGDIDVDDGDLEGGKDIERKIKVAVNLYSLSIDGKTVVMFDNINMIAEIDGVDYLADLRTHIQ